MLRLGDEEVEQLILAFLVHHDYGFAHTVENVSRSVWPEFLFIDLLELIQEFLLCVLLLEIPLNIGFQDRLSEESSGHSVDLLVLLIQLFHHQNQDLRLNELLLHIGRSLSQGF